MSSGDITDHGEAGRTRLRLYVAGTSPRSTRSIESVRRLCEHRLGGACDLEVVDIYQQAALAGEDGVVAAPTLVRLSPLPARRITGDLSDERHVLDGLGLGALGLGGAADEH
ncbi:circadian clock protein KaiB [Methylobacterium sp. Leaf123]|uniref:circadian clock KaiB family protein n=1 Tax=Methylobacterium sp. Leaf123 TaxID=1736264 RepID=UPI0006F46DB1|nr:circadian clock KaiB family protein [Methylobacterium sp. Leaf123]KQQ18206.1 circadian clock protein KaiB [Methylobacterium sp. Leaf123]